MTDVDSINIQIRMSPEERALFERTISASRCYLEFGCGGSTEIAVSKSIPFIVSVESDRSWIDTLSKKAPIAEAIASSMLRFEHVDIGPLTNWGAPKTEEKIKHWPKYFLNPFKKYGADYDFVLIDGRFRLSCAFAAYFCTSEKTLVAMHDYTYRNSYYDVEKFYNIVDSADSLYIFEKKKNVNLRSLYDSVVTSIFNFG